MIKLIRTWAVEKPWVLKIVMGIIAVTFVIGMGWWGFDFARSSEIGSVDGRPILYNEFQNQYDRIYRFYREVYQDRLTDELLQKLDLKGQTIALLIEERLLQALADREGIKVTNEELREMIQQDQAFQRGGQFDRNVYLRVLEANRLTPDLFERQQREALRIQRVRLFLGESIEVTEEEVLEQYRRGIERQKKQFKEAEYQQQRVDLRRQLLADKQAKTIRSYVDALRKKADIRIKPEFLAPPAT